MPARTAEGPTEPVGRCRGGCRRPGPIDAILDDPEVGVLIRPVTGPFPPLSDKLVQDLVDAAEHTDKLVCVVWGSPAGTEAAYRETLLGSSRVATFRTVGNCITAVRAHLDHHRFVSGHRSPFDEAPRTPSPSLRKAQALMRPGQQLSEHAAKQLLRAYGIRVPREQLVTSAAAAVRAAGLVGYPVVMKASGARITHKTELGLVSAATFDLFQGRNVVAIENMFKERRGSQTDAHYFQEILVNSENLVHLFVRMPSNDDVIAVAVARKTVNIGMLFVSARRVIKNNGL